MTKRTLAFLTAVVGGWVVATAPAAAQPAPGVLSGEPLPGIDKLAEPEPPRERREGEGERKGEGEGEKKETVESDRDAFTPQTKTVAKGRFILESSYSFIDHKAVAETHSFPEMLLRYGLTKRVELRFGWNYEIGGAGNDVSGSQSDTSLMGATGSRLAHETRVLYGVKVGVTEQQGWAPESALIVTGRTPVGGESTATQVDAAYVFGWRWANRWKSDFALRYTTASENGDHFNVWFPSAVLRVPLGERWQVHGEYFGEFSQGKDGDFSKHYLSPGAHYLITENLEVGVRVGWGINHQSDRFFVNAGFGWRF
jgi:hypothetical protein